MEIRGGEGKKTRGMINGRKGKVRVGKLGRNHEKKKMKRKKRERRKRDDGRKCNRDGEWRYGRQGRG